MTDYKGYPRAQLRALCVQHKDLLQLDCRADSASMYRNLERLHLLPPLEGKVTPKRTPPKTTPIKQGSILRPIDEYTHDEIKKLCRLNELEIDCRSSKKRLYEELSKVAHLKLQGKEIPRRSPPKPQPKQTPKRSPQPRKKQLPPIEALTDKEVRELCKLNLKDGQQGRIDCRLKKAILYAALQNIADDQLILLPKEETIPQRKPTSPKKKETTPTKPISPTKKQTTPPKPIHECLDWQVCSKKEKWNQYDIITIPRDTLLYKGRPIAYNPDLKFKHRYYGDIILASLYAYEDSGTSQYINNFTAEDGTIEVYRVTKELRLLDMESITNFNLLSELPGYTPEIAMGLNTAFNYTKGGHGGLYRRSMTRVDHALSDWICSQPPLKEIDGYGYYKLKGFHNEVMLCSSDKIEKTDYEWRYISYYQPEKLHEVVHHPPSEERQFTGRTRQFEGEKIPYNRMDMFGNDSLDISQRIKQQEADHPDLIKRKEKKYLSSPQYAYMKDPQVVAARRQFYKTKKL